MINNQAMFKLSYGLFVLSARDKDGDNACIVNTVQQVTDSPKRISVAVNKSNKTHDMIAETGIFNVSILSTDADFSVFKRFGFSSGHDTNKFSDFHSYIRTDNGLVAVAGYTNAYISARVISVIDCGTHSLFIAEVTAADVLSDAPSVTYEYYFANIKPKPKKKADDAKKGYVCKICGYVYEGDPLPPDFICPICKHGAEDFEPLK